MKKKIQKPFDVEAAKRGAKVETKGGDPVRIICYDRKSGYPIVALVNYKDNENCCTYTIEGSQYYDGPTEDDLVIVEEVEYPKFQEGAFIVFNGNVYEVSDVDDVNNLYYFQNVKYGLSQKLPIKNIDNICNSWNTNDARPGDILIDCYNKPFIFKGYTDKEHPRWPVAYCGITRLDAFAISSINYYWSDENVRPATYEERQRFFNRLEEEGYKWEAETLTLSKIQKRWRDEEDAEVNGYYIHSDSHIVKHSGYNSIMNYNIFATEELAKSALAMARISQIMKNDERFGGPITDEEWDGRNLYSIIRVNKILIVQARPSYEFLSFRTPKQADLFLEENKDLVKDYYMLG